jgi:hypothetical protein
MDASRKARRRGTMVIVLGVLMILLGIKVAINTDQIQAAIRVTRRLDAMAATSVRERRENRAMIEALARRVAGLERSR